MSKQATAESAALAALGVGAIEQKRRMGESVVITRESTQARKPTSMQLSEECLALLMRAQARLMTRGVPRATVKGVAIELILQEWLTAQG